MAAKDSTDNSKICAALSYLLIGIIWYFADDQMKKNQFAKFHAKQGLVLLIVSIILHVVARLLYWVIPMFWFIWNLIGLCILILAILGIINALNGKMNELPVIGQFAKKLDF